MAPNASPGTLSPAGIVGRKHVGGGLVYVELSPRDDVRDSYARPGQYISVHGDLGRSGYFVLAGDVGAPLWELIVRPGSDAANAVLGIPDGGSVQTTRALGEGFPVEEARGRPLLLVATGSGIAAIRPVILHRLRDRDAGRTSLLLGIRTRKDLPLTSEIATWRTKGIGVTACLSREAIPTEEAHFASGYVQDVARRTLPAAALTGGMIFAAGVPPMLEGMQDLADDLGVAEADVRMNY